MKNNKEELGKLHKERCKELKLVRAQIAKDLGIELNQTECTYEGYCSGTCPKCKSEELKLNAAILKKKLDDSNIKGRIAVAGFTTVAALSLSGCTNNRHVGELAGDVEYVGDTESETEVPDTQQWQTNDPDDDNNLPDDYEGDIQIDPDVLEGEAQPFPEDDD